MVSQETCISAARKIKGLFLKAVLPVALSLSFISFAGAQQTNIYLSFPPMIVSDMSTSRQLSASYFSVDGRDIDANVIDVNTAYRKALSETTASEITIDATLYGGILGGEMDIGELTRDVSGLILHGAYGRAFLVRDTPAADLTLFVGIPFSFGNFIIDDEKDLTMYNYIAGFRGGASLGLDLGSFTGSPFMMIEILGGYAEKYSGGVYLENLEFGSIPTFAIISAGLEVVHRPSRLSLSTVFQRNFEAGHNEKIDSFMVQVGMSFRGGPQNSDSVIRWKASH